MVKFYSDYLSALGDKSELAPAEVSKVRTTYTDKEYIMRNEGTNVVQIHYDQTIRHTLQSPYDDFDEKRLFILPFEFDVQEYLIALMEAFGADEQIFLVGRIEMHNATFYWSTNKNNDTNTTSGVSRMAVSALITVGVLSVLLIGVALVSNIHKRGEQNRQHLIFEEELQYQQQNQHELEEQEQEQQEQHSRQQQGASRAPPSRSATHGTMDTATSLDTVGMRTASMHSNTNTFGSSAFDTGFGTVTGHDGVSLPSASPPGAAAAAPRRTDSRSRWPGPAPSGT